MRLFLAQLSWRAECVVQPLVYRIHTDQHNDKRDTRHCVDPYGEHAVSGQLLLCAVRGSAVSLLDGILARASTRTTAHPIC